MRVILPLILILSPLSALAHTGHAYLGASMGASFATLSEDSPEISYAGTLTDRYPLDDTTSVAPLFSINGGYEFAGKDWKPAIMLGLGLYTTVPSYEFDGDVNETALGDPPFSLYEYSYEVSTVRLMVESQFTWEFKNFLPFIQAGIGSAWVTMDDYDENPSLVPEFQSHTQVNFAYQLGFGIAKAFHHDRIAVGYRFVGLGDTSFGTRGATYPYDLDTGTLNTNDVYFGYTHLF